MSLDKENIESTEIEYCGLCLTCMYAPSCFNRIKSKDPILFCEEFDLYTNPDLLVNPVSLPEKSARDYKEDASIYTGLCINCNHREFCKLHIPEGGVWHCEEYE